MDINLHFIDRIRMQVIGFAGEYIEPVTIVAIESEIGTDPCETTAVFNDAIDKAIGETVFGADVFDFPVVLCGVFILGRCNRNKSTDQERDAKKYG
jgi:hypothetical protein